MLQPPRKQVGRREMAFVRPKLAKILLTITAFLVIVSCGKLDCVPRVKGAVA